MRKARACAGPRRLPSWESELGAMEAPGAPERDPNAHGNGSRPGGVPAAGPGRKGGPRLLRETLAAATRPADRLPPRGCCAPRPDPGLARGAPAFRRPVAPWGPRGRAHPPPARLPPRGTAPRQPPAPGSSSATRRRGGVEAGQRRGRPPSRTGWGFSRVKAGTPAPAPPLRLRHRANRAAPGPALRLLRWESGRRGEGSGVRARLPVPRTPLHSQGEAGPGPRPRESSCLSPLSFGPGSIRTSLRPPPPPPPPGEPVLNHNSGLGPGTLSPAFPQSAAARHPPLATTGQLWLHKRPPWSDCELPKAEVPTRPGTH